jgi:Family of unknown function (DUF6439)
VKNWEGRIADFLPLNIAAQVASLDQKAIDTNSTMPDSTQTPALGSVNFGSVNLTDPRTSPLAAFSTEELAQALAQRLAITPNDWHRLKSNRKARAGEQAATALLYLLKDQPQEALARLQQATGWLDRSISAPPCPSHGDR